MYLRQALKDTALRVCASQGRMTDSLGMLQEGRALVNAALHIRGRHYMTTVLRHSVPEGHMKPEVPHTVDQGVWC